MLKEIENRRSIRKYEDRPVPDTALKQILESARLAPSGSRTDGETKIVLDETSSEFELKQIIRDTAVAVEHMVLEAEAQGLSTCWTAWFEQKDIRPVLNIPEDQFVLCVLTLGYAAEHPEPRPRKPLREMVRYETW